MVSDISEVKTDKGIVEVFEETIEEGIEIAGEKEG